MEVLAEVSSGREVGDGEGVGVGGGIIGDKGVGGKGKGVKPGELGENITTKGIDLLGLREGCVLRFVDDGDGDGDRSGDDASASPIASAQQPPTASPAPLAPAPAPAVASIRITGLRNPCPQIEKFQSGLQERFIVRDEARKIVARKAGVMGVVESGGEVRPGMRIVVVESGGGGGGGDEGGGVRSLRCV